MTRTRRQSIPAATVPLPPDAVVVDIGDTAGTEPAPPEPVVDKRRASLLVKSARGAGNDYYVKLTASNGETLGTGETHPTPRNANASRTAWVAAMIDVLEGAGFTITPPAETGDDA